MSTLETLKAARKLIESEEDWYRAPVNDPFGSRRIGGRTARCAGAALCKAGAPWPDRKDVWDALREQTAEEIYIFNANHTHAEVLRAFDEAIAKLEAQ